MNARDLCMELQLMMSRNLAILEAAVQQTPAGRRVVAVEDVTVMLRSIAANVAQAYAHRVIDDQPNNDDTICRR